MAVVPRKRKHETAYYVVVTWQGKAVWERAGTNQRAAEALDRRRKAEVRAGTYQPKSGTRAMTLRQWQASWFATRNVRSVKDERRWIRLHVLTRPWAADKPIADWDIEHTDQLVRELKAEGKLADKSIANLIGVLQPMFGAAVRAKLCIKNPIVVERKALKRTRQVEPEIYTPAEVRVLTRHHTIAWPIRVLNALCLLGGLREGEACGRRWRDLYVDCAPLWALSVHDQYGEQLLKTERPRMVPVHPELAAVLEAWGREGYELLTCRRPTPDDFIVPNVGKRAKKRHHTRSSYYKAFVRYAIEADVRPRTLHSTRHTFITLARRGGAPKDVLERVTHNAKGDMVDRYTHWEWEPLCRAVLCLDLDAHLVLHPGPGSSGKSGGAPRWLGEHKSAEVLQTTGVEQGSIPGASTLKQHKTSLSVKPRQNASQKTDRHNRVLPCPELSVEPDHYPAAWALAFAAARLGLVAGEMPILVTGHQDRHLAEAQALRSLPAVVRVALFKRSREAA